MVEAVTLPEVPEVVVVVVVEMYYSTTVPIVVVKLLLQLLLLVVYRVHSWPGRVNYDICPPATSR